ncbi:hypothetical protein BUY99_05210 [Staphylococcus gallinarum]|uniref:hypothetical protein n=1 Tax=Staphylococcus gallinarum TaxID=1293 RepID=UPI000E68E8EB|nr:hypothetical protein [Staphylococcus gallinarum]RIL23388.1 hypothetical protein BUY99_05210 [Staphylococcus gallinarum]
MIGTLKGHSGQYIGYLFGVFFSSLLFFAFSWIISGGLGFYLEELVERINMRDKNYKPLICTARIDLNYLVQLSNGYLFRQYQFINAEESGSDFIVIELPKDAKIINEANTSRENIEILNNTCMFDKVDEQELLAIITPITKYHEEKAYREKIKEEEKFVENQSKLNANITNNDIKNLPLFKSLKELKNKTDQEIQQYNEDTKNMLKENQKIIS